MSSKLISSLTAFALASVLSANLLMAQAIPPAADQQESDRCSAYPEFQCGPTAQELEQDQQRKQAKELKKQAKKQAKRECEAQRAKQHNAQREAGN
jgi:hypothetical protein